MLPHASLTAVLEPTRQIVILGVNYPPEKTGIAPYAGGLAQGLVDLGVDVSVLTAHPHYPAWRISEGYGQWTSLAVEDRVRVTRLRHYVPTRPRGLRRLASELSFGARLMFARWGSPSAIIALSPALVSTAIALARARLTHRRTPFVVWVQDLYSLGMSETEEGGKTAARVIRAIETWVLNHASCVVVIHDRFENVIRRELGISHDRFHVVRNWSHVPAVNPIDRRAARCLLGWRTEETVVLHAGNMGRKQGLENVINAARLASSDGLSIRFVFLGGGAEREYLEGLASDLPQVNFLGTLSDEQFVQALQAADILLVNEKKGISEMAVPSKLTSYFAAGRPIIAATDEEGITAHELRASDAGHVVRAGDPVALLQAVLTLRENSDRAHICGENGKKFSAVALKKSVAINTFDRILNQAILGRNM